MKNFLRNEDGSMGMMFAVVGPVMLLAVGVAVDYANFTKTKQISQNALDASILAAVIHTELDTAKKQDLALEMFLLNTGYNAEDVSLTLNAEGVDVFGASVDVNTKFAFGGVIGIDETTINVGSETVFKKGEVPKEDTGAIPNILGDACVIALGNQQWQPGIRFNSQAEIISRDCELHVHNAGTQAVNFNSNVVVDVQKLCIAGSGTLDNRQQHERTTNIEYNCVPEPDPFPNGVTAMTNSGCDYYNFQLPNNATEATLDPGIYCGWVNFNGNPDIHFNPGTYVIKNGGWNVNGGNFTGDGVTFYFNDNSSKIQFNSNVNVRLSAPATGDYAGILITDGPNVNSGQDFILNAAAISDNQGNDLDGYVLHGLVYLPTRNVTMNSGSAVTSAAFGLVAENITINSQASINLSPVDVPYTTNGEGGVDGTGDSNATVVAETETSNTQASIDVRLVR